jgi:hypothetical protein
VRGRRWVGGIGSGGTGGGAWGCTASCAHRAQGGLCVRPANGGGSLERVRLGLRGSASAGPDGVQHHTEPQKSQHHELRVKKVWNHSIAPSPWDDMGALYRVFGARQLSAGYRYTTRDPGSILPHRSRRDREAGQCPAVGRYRHALPTWGSRRCPDHLRRLSASPSCHRSLAGVVSSCTTRATCARPDALPSSHPLSRASQAQRPAAWRSRHAQGETTCDSLHTPNYGATHCG